MSAHPTTFQGEPADSRDIHWNDLGELHRREDGGGVLHQFKAIRRGNIAELIAFVMRLPETEQPNYAIQKDGDHRMEIGEIRALAGRVDFPG
ncbi:MAG: hypothetical protein M0R03_09890 [Novosphingobium sp.]|nr:hypothetical protein [Novosphingobium sp.]